jgi:kynurenine formamidase
MTTIIALVIAIGFAQANDCQTSKWGPDDELGAANLITPASVLAASKLIKTGKTYALGITVDSNTPAFPPRSLSLQIVQPNQQGGQALFQNNLTYNDDIFQGWFGIGSQIDGLGHAGHDGVYYNCNKQEDFAFITGLKKLAVDKIPPIVARGVLLDMAGHFGVEHLEAGPRFNVEDIKAAARNQGVEIREGDVVLFYTGWTEHMLPSDPKKWGSTAPGPTEDAIKYLASKNVVAVGSDTFSFDPIPPDVEGRPFQGHIILLAENGIYILEVMNTGEMVKDKAWEFLFVLGQAKINGTAQMMINPVAIR